MMRSAAELVQKFGDLLNADDDTAYDLLATDFVNHAAGPQGRDGFRLTMTVIRHDLADIVGEDVRLIAQDDLVVAEWWLHGTHVASTMPLLAGIEPRGVRVCWRYVHTFRVADGLIVEHWATRDDLGLLMQLDAWRPGAVQQVSATPEG